MPRRKWVQGDEMTPEIVHGSIVVVARQHNPTILHPAFLAGQGIVPKDWQVSGDPICIPPLATVEYENGIQFSVQTEKLKVQHDHPPVDMHESPVPDLVEKYVRALPHVNYTAVGVNMTVFVELKSADEYLVRRFLKEDACPFEGKPPRSAGMKMSYPIGNMTYNLELDAGKLQHHLNGKERSGIIVRGNFHHPVQSDDENTRLARIHDVVETFADRCVTFLNHIEKILVMEDAAS